MNKKRIIAGMLLCAASLPGLWCLEWPVTGYKPLRFFGQRAEGVIERGITVEKAETVRAAGHGRLLLTLSEKRNLSGFPGTLGNAVILAHDEGLLTVYGNLDSVALAAERSQIDSQSILGIGGKSGWGYDGCFSFMVIDHLKNTLLNPLLLIPSPQDSRGPVIRNVVMVSGSNQGIALGNAKGLRQGTYRLYADVSDTVDGSSNELSPFRISVLVNGSEHHSLPFELLKEENGRVFLSERENTRDSLYGDSSRTFLGEITLSRGRADLAIIARDTSGNERSVQFGLIID